MNGKEMDMTCKWCDMDGGGHRAVCPDHPGNVAYRKLDDNYRLKSELDACHDELRRISDALGTNEGHSSVDHILQLKSDLSASTALVGRIRSRLVEAESLLEDVKLALPHPTLMDDIFGHDTADRIYRFLTSTPEQETT